MKNLLPSLATGLVLTLGGCAPQVDTEVERIAIRTFHDECLSAQITGNVDCFAEDGQMLPNEFPPIKGKSVIAEVVPQMISDPNFAVSHDIVDIDVSRSGDLAYIHYTYKFTMSDPGGNPVTEHGNAIYILKKQPQVGWEYLLDLSNSAAEDVGDVDRATIDHEAAAEAVVAQLWRAFEIQDLDLLSQVMAHDSNMIIIGTDAAERWVGYEPFIAAEEKMFASFDFERLSIHDQVLTVHESGHVAWFSAIVDGEVTVGERHQSVGGIRITGVLEKRGPGWVIVQYHSSVPVAGQNIEY